MDIKDAELIRKSQEGNIDAFEQLVLRYEKRIYTIAYKYMGNYEDASDMAQEALIKAYQSIGSFRGDAAFGTWLGKITANRCLDELRKRKHIPTTSLDHPVEFAEGSVQKELECPAATPEETAIKKEIADYIQQIIGELKEEYRVAILLREMEGHSYEEIAEILSCSLGTVKSRISRARQYLKERIIQENVLERGKKGV